MDNRWYLAIDTPESGCHDFAGFFLFEIDEQQRMTLLERWFVDAAVLTEKDR